MGFGLKQSGLILRADAFLGNLFCSMAKSTLLLDLVHGMIVSQKCSPQKFARDKLPLTSDFRFRFSEFPFSAFQETNVKCPPQLARRGGRKLSEFRYDPILLSFLAL
jgi:hypothetical protein